METTTLTEIADVVKLNVKVNTAVLVGVAGSAGASSATDGGGVDTLIVEAVSGVDVVVVGVAALPGGTSRLRGVGVGSASTGATSVVAVGIVTEVRLAVGGGSSRLASTSGSASASTIGRASITSSRAGVASGRTSIAVVFSLSAVASIPLDLIGQTNEGLGGLVAHRGVKHLIEMSHRAEQDFTGGQVDVHTIDLAIIVGTEEELVLAVALVATESRSGGRNRTPNCRVGVRGLGEVGDVAIGNEAGKNCSLGFGGGSSTPSSSLGLSLSPSLSLLAVISDGLILDGLHDDVLLGYVLLILLMGLVSNSGQVFGSRGDELGGIRPDALEGY